MKSATLSLVAVTATLGIVSAWNITVYNQGTIDCARTPELVSSPNYFWAYYEGKGTEETPCIEAGMDPGANIAECSWGTNGTWGSKPCTRPMNPTPGSVAFGWQMECRYFEDRPGMGMMKFGEGRCVDEYLRDWTLENECRQLSGQPDYQFYFLCRDKPEPN